MRIPLPPLALAACLLAAAPLAAQDLESRLARSDLLWTEIDDDFYNGAFIGDGIQGAMIMEDEDDPDGLRMLMGHYQAIAHQTISGWEYANSRLFCGDIRLLPVGRAQSRTMRLDLWNGEARGTIETTRGSLSWSALADRQHRTFAVRMETDAGEADAVLTTREQWGISPRFALENRDPNDFPSFLPPQPEVTTEGGVRFLTQRNRTRGAYVTASRLVPQADGSKVLFVAIGVSDTHNTTTAASEARADALARLDAAVAEGYGALLTRHRAWWHDYWQISTLEIREDPEWEKFFHLQLYKFACASAEDSAYLIDTQGPWIWKTAWAGVWYNLNVQLSYFPAFAANRLDVGKSLVNGVDRIYESGALAQNAGGTGISLGRSGTYEGFAGWGDEYGNLPWLLHDYWKYWRYSGDDSLAPKLFAMLRDNATYLRTRLTKTDGTYHVVPSRSPEYEDSVLYPDANYALMSIHWVLTTILAMDTELGYNDPRRAEWQELLDNLAPFPANENGFMVGSNQAFDKSHRHYSHLLAIYPYHTVKASQGAAVADLVRTSIDRFMGLKGAQIGYTFTGGAAMYASLGEAELAIEALDGLKSYLRPNTMYGEGGGPVIETPLSAVESIAYMVLQSWDDGLIRIFPASPARWENVAFTDFRTEGAFLVSARKSPAGISDVTIESTVGGPCRVVNPWPGEILVVRTAAGASVATTAEGEIHTFATTAGTTYALAPAGPPALSRAAVEEGDPDRLVLGFSEPIAGNGPFTGFSLSLNGGTPVALSATRDGLTGVLGLNLPQALSTSDTATLSYSGGGVATTHGFALAAFNDHPVDNLRSGSAPRLVEAIPSDDGTRVWLTFNKPLAAPGADPAFTLERDGSPLPLLEVRHDPAQPERLELVLDGLVTRGDTLTLSYTGSTVAASDGGQLAVLSDAAVTPHGPGPAPQVVSASVAAGGLAVDLVLDLPTRVTNQFPFFRLTRDGQPVTVTAAATSGNTVRLTPAVPLRAGQAITLSYDGGLVETFEGGRLAPIGDLAVTNAQPVPTYRSILDRLEAEDFAIMSGVQVESTTDLGGGSAIGFIDTGDWLEYAIDVPADGIYPVTIRYSSQGGGGRIALLDGDLRELNTIALPGTGGWQTWKSVVLPVSLEAGEQILRVSAKRGGFNLNWFELIDRYAQAPEAVPAWETTLRANLEAMVQTLEATVVPWTVPDRTFRPEDFGAVADGATMNTTAIQAAIDACTAAGGGVVLFSSGDYVTGTFRLKDNVMIEVAEGARILGSTDIADYPEIIEARRSVMRDNHLFRTSLIYAEGVSNIGIRGLGTIDFRGTTDNFASPQTVGPIVDRPFGIRVIECSNIVLRDITLLDSAAWMQSYLACDNLLFERVKVENQANWNNDGFDIDGCHNVIMRDCWISAEDDALCFKGASMRSTENVLVENCEIYSNTNSVKFGTDSQGDFRNVLIRDCKIGGPDPSFRRFKNYVHTIAGIAWESVDGAIIEDVLAERIEIVRADSPIFLRLADRGRVPPGDPRPGPGALRRIVFDNIVATDWIRYRGSPIAGIPGAAIEDVVVRNFTLRTEGGAVSIPSSIGIPEKIYDYPEANMFGTPLPAFAFWVRNATDVHFYNISYTLDKADVRPAIATDRASVIVDDPKGHALMAEREGDTVTLFNSTDVSARDLMGAGTFVKHGGGTVTFTDPIRFTGDMLVKKGDVRLLQGQRAGETVVPVPPPAPAHRWSFNGDLTDSAGDSPATIVDKGPNNATVSATAVTLTGGDPAISDHVLLGSNLVGGVARPVSIELWATQLSLNRWSRIFDFGQGGNTDYLLMSWNRGEADTDGVRWRDGGSDALRVDNSNAPYTLGTEYHIVMTLQPLSGGATEVTWYSAPSGAASIGAARRQQTVALSLAQLNDAQNTLGLSLVGGTGDLVAHAAYNEVRIWDGVLKPEDVVATHAAGPNSIPTLQGAPGSVEPTPVLRSLAISPGAAAELKGGSIQFETVTVGGALRLKDDADLIVNGNLAHTGLLDVLAWDRALPLAWIGTGDILEVGTPLPEPRPWIENGKLWMEFDSFDGHDFQLYASGDLGLTDAWTPTGSTVKGNGGAVLLEAPLTASTRFFKVALAD
jgi:alpha-L-fucosidase 2